MQAGRKGKKGHRKDPTCPSAPPIKQYIHSPCTIYSSDTRNVFLGTKQYIPWHEAMLCLYRLCKKGRKGAKRAQKRAMPNPTNDNTPRPSPSNGSRSFSTQITDLNQIICRTAALYGDMLHKKAVTQIISASHGISYLSKQLLPVSEEAKYIQEQVDEIKV